MKRKKKKMIRDRKKNIKKLLKYHFGKEDKEDKIILILAVQPK